jgi:protein gp37
MTAQAAQPGMWGHGFAEMGPNGASWTGKIELQEDQLGVPLGWAEPRRIFVSSISDLFHESLTNEQIDCVFAVMALAPQHIFQVLTKRPKTMQPYLADPATVGRIEQAMAALAPAPSGPHKIATWPLPNVWLGVTAENQKEADRRIPILLETPAAVRWIAAEPLLENIDLKAGSWLKAAEDPAPKLDWIVAGGEISAEAKACHLDWARSLRDQCAKNGTPFFWNHWGEHIPAGVEAASLLDGILHQNYPAAKA